MLIVLQGPKGSGKSTLAHAIAKLTNKPLIPLRLGMKIKDTIPNNIHIYDNVDANEEDAQVLHDSGEHFNIIVTTRYTWPRRDDYVIKMESILYSRMMSLDSILKRS